MKPHVDRLLDIKINAPELKEIDRIEPLHEYISMQLASVRAGLTDIPDTTPASWNELNQFFLTEITQ